MDEGVVERGKDTGNAEDELALLSVNLRSAGLEFAVDSPRGPGVQAGCSPERHARPSSWAAYCLVLIVDDRKWDDGAG